MALFLSRLGLWVLSVVFGSLGVFLVYISFWVPICGLHALIVLFLAIATYLGATRE